MPIPRTRLNLKGKTQDLKVSVFDDNSVYLEFSSGRDYSAVTLKDLRTFAKSILTIEETVQPPLPTTPGLYVPANNKNILSMSYVYHLDGLGQWTRHTHMGGGDKPGTTGQVAADAALNAHKTLGGLVKLVAAG